MLVTLVTLFRLDRRITRMTRSQQLQQKHNNLTINGKTMGGHLQPSMGILWLSLLEKSVPSIFAPTSKLIIYRYEGTPLKNVVSLRNYDLLMIWMSTQKILAFGICSMRQVDTGELVPCVRECRILPFSMITFVCIYRCLDCKRVYTEIIPINVRLNCKRVHRATICPFADRALYPFADNYFSAIKPFQQLEKYQVINPFAVDATKYLWK